MENMKLTNKEQSDLRKELDKKETEYMRFKRRKLTPTDFDTIKIIGRGAFGEVRFSTLTLFFSFLSPLSLLSFSSLL